MQSDTGDRPTAEGTRTFEDAKECKLHNTIAKKLCAEASIIAKLYDLRISTSPETEPL